MFIFAETVSLNHSINYIHTFDMTKYLSTVYFLYPFARIVYNLYITWINLRQAAN